MVNRLKLAVSFAAAALVLAGLSAEKAEAQHIRTYSFTSGAYSAEAVFTKNGTNLEILFRNTSTVAVADNPYVLTGLFFNADDASLAKSSLSLAPGSVFVRTDSNLESADKHWAYKGGVSTGADSWNHGIGAAGFGIFGDADAFAGGGSSPVLDGVDYGLVGTLSGSPSGGLKKNLIDDQIKIVLTGWTGTDITRVRFQWGSSLTENSTTITRVPEPAFYQMAALLALGGLGILRFRKNREQFK
jgi:hypothetical protein